MNLTAEQKLLVTKGVTECLDLEDSVTLVRLGENWARVSRLGNTWRGYVVHQVDEQDNVWKTDWVEDTTRRGVIAQLEAQNR